MTLNELSSSAEVRFEPSLTMSGVHSLPRAGASGLTVRSGDLSVLLAWREDTDKRKALRASIILLSASGASAEAVRTQLGVAMPTVYKWCRRYLRHGLAGLSDLPRSGQPRRLSAARREEILRITQQQPPPKGGRWTIRVAARHLGVTQHQIRRVWADAGIKPHRDETAKPPK